MTILAEGCIDAVNLANDHSHDYGNESYVDTLANLNIAGISHFGYDKTLLLSVDGVAVGLTGVYDQEPDANYQTQALENIQLLEDEGAQIIIVELDWSGEPAEVPDDTHRQVAHAAIDAGADLVIGHHPHVLQGIELYKGKYIAYSLGDFCTGASSEVYDTMVFQQTFTVVDGACQQNPELKIIPCSTSSQTGKNTYCPTPAQGDKAQSILDEIYALSSQIEGGISQSEDTDAATLEALPPSPN